MPRSLPAIHVQGHLPLLAAGLAAIFGFGLLPLLGWLGLLATLACLVLYRDPERVTPLRDGLVIAPADGTILRIDEAVPPEALDMGDHLLRRVLIAPAPLGTTVNRAPLSGVVTRLAAERVFDLGPVPAADVFERQSEALRISAEGMGEVGLQRVAGRLGLRPSISVSLGDALKVGQRLGTLSFGRSVALLLPREAAILVSEGQQVIAGETVIADFRATEGLRESVRQ